MLHNLRLIFTGASLSVILSRPKIYEIKIDRFVFIYYYIKTQNKVKYLRLLQGMEKKSTQKSMIRNARAMVPFLSHRKRII